MVPLVFGHLSNSAGESGSGGTASDMTGPSSENMEASTPIQGKNGYIFAV